MERRTLLKRGIFGGALLFIGSSAYLGSKSGQKVASPAALSVFGVHAYAVMVAVCEAVLPHGEDAIQAAYNVDQSLLNAPLRTQKDLNDALILLDNAFIGVFTRASTQVFTKMPFGSEEMPREQALLSWRDSRFTLFRGAYHSLRRLALAGHYSNLESAKKVNYPGPPFLKPDPGPIVANAPLSPVWKPNLKPEEVQP